MSHVQLKTQGKHPSPVTPREFFTSICPKVLGLHEAVCKKLGGRYAFQLFGEGGGAWTLDYAASVVHDGVVEQSDLYLEMDAIDFTELIKGTLDVEKAVSQGRIRVGGDPALFSNLVAVLEPAEA